MRWTGTTGVLLLLSSILLLVGAFINGDAELYLVLIIPVIRFESWIGLLAVVAFISGLVMTFISFTPSHKGSRNGETESSKGETSWGGIAFIGPIPVTFGDRKTRDKFPSWWKLLIIGVVLMFLLYLLAFFLAGIFF
ncbi:MAG: TIGR00304 family membrane protein [Thermoplasmatota archaeon]